MCLLWALSHSLWKILKSSVLSLWTKYFAHVGSDWHCKTWTLFLHSVPVILKCLKFTQTRIYMFTYLSKFLCLNFPVPTEDSYSSFKIHKLSQSFIIQSFLIKCPGQKHFILWTSVICSIWCNILCFLDCLPLQDHELFRAQSKYYSLLCYQTFKKTLQSWHLDNLVELGDTAGLLHGLCESVVTTQSSFTMVREQVKLLSQLPSWCIQAGCKEPSAKRVAKETQDMEKLKLMAALLNSMNSRCCICRASESHVANNKLSINFLRKACMSMINRYERAEEKNSLHGKVDSQIH